MTLEEAHAAKGKADDRHEGMEKLMKALNELYELFADLALWVEDQSELLDSVEVHIENSVDYVRKATKDTRQAVLYARAARRVSTHSLNSIEKKVYLLQRPYLCWCSVS